MKCPNKLASQTHSVFFMATMIFSNIKINLMIAVYKLFHHHIYPLPGRRGGLGLICEQPSRSLCPRMCVGVSAINHGRHWHC